MIAADLKKGTIILINNEYFRVLDTVYHKGTATMGSMVHVKMKNLSTGNIKEERFSPDTKLQDIHPERKNMQFLYREGDKMIFLDTETYEQIEFSSKSIGPAADYITENSIVPVEFHNEKPLGIIFSDVVEIRVKYTGQGIKGQADNTYKPAVLENNVEIMVPQFIETGDIIKVEVETGRYVERVTKK